MSKEKIDWSDPDRIEQSRCAFGPYEGQHEPQRPDHPMTNKCQYDREASIEARPFTYVCGCGFSTDKRTG